jgi:hypothetical protein
MLGNTQFITRILIFMTLLYLLLVLSFSRAGIVSYYKKRTELRLVTENLEDVRLESESLKMKVGLIDDHSINMDYLNERLHIDFGLADENELVIIVNEQK